MDATNCTHLERRYQCWDDCQMQGCPGHVATLDFQSVSDHFLFRDGKGGEIGLHPVELDALLDMVKELAGWRIEAANIIAKVQDTRHQ